VKHVSRRIIIFLENVLKPLFGRFRANSEQSKRRKRCGSKSVCTCFSSVFLSEVGRPLLFHILTEEPTLSADNQPNVRACGFDTIMQRWLRASLRRSSRCRTVQQSKCQNITGGGTGAGQLKLCRSRYMGRTCTCLVS